MQGQSPIGNEIHEGHMNDDTRGQRSNMADQSGNSLPGYKKEPRNPLHKCQHTNKLTGN